MRVRTRYCRFFLLALAGGFAMVCVLMPLHRPIDSSYTIAENTEDLFYEDTCNTSVFSSTPHSGLSRLSRHLFFNESEDLMPQSRNFTILIWKSGPALERRHIKHFTSQKFDPFEGCSVSNCKITYEDSYLSSADAVLFHLHRIKGPSTMPTNITRPPHQRWVFLSDESPSHTFLSGSSKNKIEMYNGLFNWSMTYRVDSDVPVPYGRTVVLNDTEKRQAFFSDHAVKKSGLVAIMMSNCGGNNGRLQYVREMQKHLKVDVYGGCGPLKCPGHFGKDCPLLSNYKFYLAFENTNCKDYITEKAWWNAYAHGAVPIIMGISIEDAKRLLPPKSYIHSAEFASPADLARYLQYLDKSDSEYREYLKWKKCYKILNEHGYFQTPVFHYCRLCEALNYNDASPKIYENLLDFWSTEKFCYDKYW